MQTFVAPKLQLQNGTCKPASNLGNLSPRYEIQICAANLLCSSKPGACSQANMLLARHNKIAAIPRILTILNFLVVAVVVATSEKKSSFQQHFTSKARCLYCTQRLKLMTRICFLFQIVTVVSR